MKKKKYILFSLGFLCLLLGLYGLKMFQMKRPALQSVAAQAKIKAETLYAAFNSNEDSANQHYLNAVLEVSGEIVSVPGPKSRAILLSGGTASLGGINCELRDANHIQGKLKIGELITLKGRCTGYLMDVNLTDAVIVQN